MLKSKPKTKSQKMREHASELADKIAPHVESAREKAAPVIADAREKAAPVLAEAREKGATVFEEAREKATPAIDTARDKFTSDVLPVLTAAVVAASEATEEARTEAKRRGLATAAALKGEVEAPKKKKESHKLRTFLVLLGLGGIAAFVAKKLSDRQASTAWQSSYTPTPASTPTPADDTPMGTAAAAAAPDEAAADAAEQPHSATTPDNPVEEIRVEDKDS